MSNTSDLESKIIKQVEFYFGDSNLPRDKFLLSEMAKDSDAYVSIDIIASFSRMKALTTELSVIKEALKKSSLLKLSDDETKVKRTTPLPEEIDFSNRRIYARRFPDSTTIDQVEALFSPFGKVTRVSLRKTKDGIFKRSVFVEFASPKEAEEALKQKLSFDGAELTLLSLEAYNQEKREELQGKGTKRKGSQKQKKEKEEGDDEEKDDEENGEKEVKKRDYTPGTVLKFESIAPTTLGSLKDLFKTKGQVQFVTYVPQATSGFVRFVTPDDTQAALSYFSQNTSELGPENASISLLSGDEEKVYWEEAFKGIDEMNKNKNKKGNRRSGGGRRGGRGGRGGGGKRRKTQ